MSHNLNTNASGAPSGHDLFGEPISVYSDTQAVDDGFLVDVSRLTRVRFLGCPINRMPRRLFEDLEPFIEAEAAAFDGSTGKALASILSTKCRLAKGSPDNTGEVGDIYRILPDLWLVRNETRRLEGHVPGRVLVAAECRTGAEHPSAPFLSARIPPQAREG